MKKITEVFSVAVMLYFLMMIILTYLFNLPKGGSELVERWEILKTAMGLFSLSAYLVILPLFGFLTAYLGTYIFKKNKMEIKKSSEYKYEMGISGIMLYTIVMLAVNKAVSPIYTFIVLFIIAIIVFSYKTDARRIVLSVVSSLILWIVERVFIALGPVVIVLIFVYEKIQFNTAMFVFLIAQIVSYWLDKKGIAHNSRKYIMYGMIALPIIYIVTILMKTL